MTSRYFTPQNLTPFTRALASGVNVNLSGLDAAFEQVQSEIDGGADILLRDDLASSATGKGAALVRYGGETVKAVLDKLTNPSTLAAAGTLTGAESLALFNGTALTNLVVGRLAHAVTDQYARFKNSVAASFGEVGAESNDRSIRIGVRSSTHSGGELCYLLTPNAIPMAFYVNGGERARISASGNVGIGAVNPNFKLDVNGQIRGSANIGALIASNGSGSGQSTIWIRREGAPANQKDWEIIQDASGTFTIRTVNDAYNAAGDAVAFTRGAGVAVDNIAFATNGAYRWQIQNDGHFRPVTDNAYALGISSFRTSVIYSVTGTINTSDEREKTWRGSADAAELRAARRVIGELGFYQWDDAIEEKGADSARYHFGVRAQRVFAIFTDEGLDPHRYAFLCYDAWEEKREPVMAQRIVKVPREVEVPTKVLGSDGQPVTKTVIEYDETEETYNTGETRVTLEARDRYGVRPDQLALFLIAALAAPTQRKRPAKKVAAPKGQRGHG